MSDLQSKTEGVSSLAPPAPEWEATADVVVVGTGVAGLTAALRTHELGLRTLVVTKAGAAETTTCWAQGGVAVVLDDNAGERANEPAGAQSGDTVVGSRTGAGGAPAAGIADGDSVARHLADTVAAGAGLCDEPVARSIIAGGGQAFARLRDRGAVFDRRGEATGELARTREGGHSALRVVHAGGDATGAEIQRALTASAGRVGIAVLEHHIAADALQAPGGAVAGLRVLGPDGTVGVVRAPAVLLATGGFGQLYHTSSNPEIATGDGLALGLRAGASAADLEFVQFHPTVLYTPGARGRCPLISEAVRGEGATLIDATGAPVMTGEHPMADLAPRDVVSAAITRTMAEAPGGVAEHVYLDATAIAGFAQRFPTISAACARAGIDPAGAPIPVAPAAHFACGGLRTCERGRSDVPGLYAAGEVARTGLHGANRLASNSLLEGLVMGKRAAEAVAADLAAGRLPRRPAPPLAAEATGASGTGQLARCADRAVLQQAMSRHGAIGRDAAGLAALGQLAAAAPLRALDTPAAVEDAALTLVARVLASVAAARTESRGAHLRTDHPVSDDRRWAASQHVRLDAAGDPLAVGPIRAAA